MKNNLKKHIQGQKGLIKLGVQILIGILILSFFGFSLRDLINSDATQDNFGYLGEVFNNYIRPFWNTYLAGIFNFFIELIKDSFLLFQEYIDDPSDLPINVPPVR